MSEHLDLRHIMGAGIAITRGSAASLSFCYSLLLLTMCRNLITKMKEHSLHQYIPLDSHLQFHKIVACTGIPSLTRNSTNAIFTNAIFFLFSPVFLHNACSWAFGQFLPCWNAAHRPFTLYDQGNAFRYRSATWH